MVDIQEAELNFFVHKAEWRKDTILLGVCTDYNKNINLYIPFTLSIYSIECKDYEHILDELVIFKELTLNIILDRNLNN